MLTAAGTGRRRRSKGCLGKHVHWFLQKAWIDTSTERKWLGQAHMQVSGRKRAEGLRHANDGLHMHRAGGTFFLAWKKSNINCSWLDVTLETSEAKFCQRCVLGNLKWYFMNACERNFAQLQFSALWRTVVPVLPEGTRENFLLTVVSFNLPGGREFTWLVPQVHAVSVAVGAQNPSICGCCPEDSAWEALADFSMRKGQGVIDSWAYTRFSWLLLCVAGTSYQRICTVCWKKSQP